jgi:hypothetical protein
MQNPLYPSFSTELCVFRNIPDHGVTNSASPWRSGYRSWNCLLVVQRLSLERKPRWGERNGVQRLQSDRFVSPKLFAHFSNWIRFKVSKKTKEKNFSHTVIGAKITGHGHGAYITGQLSLNQWPRYRCNVVQSHLRWSNLTLPLVSEPHHSQTGDKSNLNARPAHHHPCKSL